MNDKKLWVIEQTSLPKPDTYIFFVRASELRYAHQAGQEKFGKGVSFKTREPNRMEKQLANAYDAIEAS